MHSGDNEDVTSCPDGLLKRLIGPLYVERSRSFPPPSMHSYVLIRQHQMEKRAALENPQRLSLSLVSSVCTRRQTALETVGETANFSLLFLRAAPLSLPLCLCPGFFISVFSTRSGPTAKESRFQGQELSVPLQYSYGS